MTLGFLRRPDDPEVVNHVRALTISSVPRSWGSDDLSTFLASVGWTDLDQLNRRGKRPSWTYPLANFALVEVGRGETSVRNVP